jgi:hypothetical protein
VSEIRPFTRADVTAVAELHAQAIARRPSDLAARLASFFERTLIDSPLADPEIPSLVAVEDGRVVGFLGSYVRPALHRERPLRLACSAHLLTDARVRHHALGGLLLRTYLAGPQDVTVTDGATREVQQIWEALRGRTAPLQGLVWIELIAPARLAAHRAAARVRRLDVALAPLARVVDTAARPLLRRAAATGAASRAIDAARFAEVADGIAASFDLRARYDADLLRWQFAELSRLASEPPPFPDRVERGTLEAREVIVSDRTVGAFVAQTRRNGACRLLAAVVAPRNAPALLDAVRERAVAGGAAAVFGRAEPHLLAALWERGVHLRFGGGRMLVASRDEELERAPATGDALLTRLDGEWW